MRKISFVIFLVGMISLILIMNFDIKEIKNIDDLNKQEINQKVKIEGKVVDQRILYKNTRLLTLNNGIELICECISGFKEKEVRIEGKVEEYNGKKQVRVLTLEYAP